MTPEERAEFIIEARRFLTSISYGAPFRTRSSDDKTFIIDKETLSINKQQQQQPQRSLKVLRSSRRSYLTTTFAKWIDELPDISHTRRICLNVASLKGLGCTYRTSIFPYLSPPIRKALEADSQSNRKRKNSLIVLERPRAGKVHSYRHLLKRLRRAEGRHHHHYHHYHHKDEWDHGGGSGYPSDGSSSTSSTSSNGSSISGSGPTKDKSDSDSEQDFDAMSMSSSEEEQLVEIEKSYNPEKLDNPGLRSGRHRTASINHYTKADLLKREVNEKFRKFNPRLDPTLTLTQIRGLKGRLLEVGQFLGLEAVTVARAYVYLEKLILGRVVGKANRRLVGGCCLMLATKATDSKNTNYGRLLAGLATKLSVPQDDLIAFEFPVWARLGFRLQVGEEQYGVHLQRILATLDYSTVREYLGERMWNNWQEATTTIAEYDDDDDDDYDDDNNNNNRRQS